MRPPGKRLDRHVSHALLLHPFHRQVEYLRRLVLVYTITRRKNYKLSTLAKLSWFRFVLWCPHVVGVTSSDRWFV